MALQLKAFRSSEIVCLAEIRLGINRLADPSSTYRISLMRLQLWRRCSAIALVCALHSFGQTKVDVKTQTKSVDFSGATATKPAQMGTVLPSTCSQGQFFFLTTAPAGQNVFGCSAANVWSLEGAAIPQASLVPSLLNNAGKLLTTDGNNPLWQTPTGDVTGSAGSLTVGGLLGRKLSSVTPTDGQLLKYNGTTGVWESVALSGDVSGAPASLTVAALQGRSISNATPGNGQLLGWSASSGSWTPTAVQTPPNFGATFAGLSTVTIPGTQHNLNTPNITVNCYDNSAPANLVEPSRITVDPVAYNVTITFANPQSGSCVLNGSGGVGIGATALTGSASLTFSSINSGACGAELTIPVSGANLGNGVAPGWPVLPAGFMGLMRVSAAGTVAVRMCNFSGLAAGVGALVYGATVVRAF